MSKKKNKNELYNSERLSNSSTDSNNENNSFFSPSNSPILSSNNYKQLEKVPLLSNNIPESIINTNENNECNEYNECTNENNECTYEDKNNDKISSTMDKKITLESLMLNLKIISKLKPGYKLSIKENNEIFIDTSYLQYFYRIFSDNSRINTTKFLDELDLHISFKIEEIVNSYDSNLFLNSKENILLNLSQDLNLSLVGLRNLIKTYDSDEYIISKIEMIINNFQLKIRKISNILKVN